MKSDRATHRVDTRLEVLAPRAPSNVRVEDSLVDMRILTIRPSGQR